ncbi:MAG: acyl-[acyl-carrier-protein]--UDP-N-acetylglucosamine O-acyltransferase [Pelagibacteraceae bacterium]|nr:acyl-[acyl-carrier-protein]--UDP-N-acetylglucosamine O-acyltransferase [Pelagibacteraceae bacterium]
MESLIHPSSYISSNAKIASDVYIGPFCAINDNVIIESNSKLISHVCISGNTIIGKENTFYPFSNIGSIPQDLKYKGENSSLQIGNKNIFRENTTVNIGTKGGGMNTTIGNECLFMVGSHIAHDCNIGNKVILANNATLAGHVNINDNAIIGGLAAIHQFVRIGKYAMIGGMSGVEYDIIPYGIYMGIRSNLRGLNLIGLKRKGLDSKKINELQLCFNEIFEKKQPIEENIKKIQSKTNTEEVNDIINFILQKSRRGICTPKI